MFTAAKLESVMILLIWDTKCISLFTSNVICHVALISKYKTEKTIVNVDHELYGMFVHENTIIYLL